ncbi:zinc-binding alcohol dehydrogenase family protein [Sinorhizobium americanum]|uniref:Zinc-type alcohol dehydrogenase protein n=1 Tax=Sinorhizobium americanum TaxID=194963 RepID=A0A1L3LH54_9HYPH|nr:zinc-binding alcohol dehydrogenase family protein [Sinorhizobium americanum]APG82826.1 zinc-type alcohol dehydrogenase protein [Sinorhizobium americanum CCGM7]APG89365.1 zinc-type alcohol dehydrogenase protein [Sinorhizobium americanum]OAP49348.1 dehydrogenase [Sinorhizobium americanum]
MKAVVCAEPGRLEVADRPRPAAPSEGWARLAVNSVGICGTDYHIFEGKHPFLEYPRVMGHEISATVVETGPDSLLPLGTLVVVNPYISCGACIACRRGKPNCCTAIRVLGVHTDGAFCEEILMPEENLYPANGLSPGAAATVEFLAIGAHAVRRSGAAPGARSLVIGAGPIGLGTAIFSRIAGHEVALLDTSAERLAFAAGELGFSGGLVAGEGLEKAVAEATGGDGFDVVFDATGNAASMERSFAHVAHGGTLVFVSVVKNDIRFADPEFHKREMRLVASRNATRADFDHVIASIARGLVPVDKLVTHTTTLERCVDDLPRWAHDKAGLVKAIVTIGGK